MMEHARTAETTIGGVMASVVLSFYSNTNFQNTYKIMNVQLNEIRLGNWFHHNVSVWTSRNDDGVISNHGQFAEDCFQWEESDWYGLSECTMFIEAIEPIPLSEEWIKLSNVKKRNGYPYEFLNGYIVLCDGKYYFKYHDIFICVDYVHQLQNLFFVFRGEELVFSSTEP